MGACREGGVKMKDRPFKTGGQWVEIFRRALGLGHREAVEMFRTLEKNGVMERRRNGVWGFTYAMRKE